MAWNLCRLLFALAILGASASLQAKPRNEELVDAARSGELEKVKRLLDQGLAVKGAVTDQALMSAADFGHMKVVEEFISRKLLPRRNIQDELFLLAAFKGNQSVASALMEDGVRLDSSVKNRFFPGGRLGGLALLVAAHRRQEAMVQFLLDYKVDPNATNDSGRYMWDVWHDREGMLKPIHSSSEEAYIDDTPLIAAARVSASEVIKALLEGGANVNARNKAGVTALMAAASGNWAEPEPVRLLVSGGANVTERDRRGRTALDSAREKLDELKKTIKEQEDRLGSRGLNDEQREGLEMKRDRARVIERVIEFLAQATAEKDKKPGLGLPGGTAARKFDLPARVHCKGQTEAFSDEGCTQPAGMFNPPVQLDLVQFLERSAAYQVTFRQGDGKEITVYCRKKDIENNCQLDEKDKKP